MICRKCGDTGRITYYGIEVPCEAAGCFADYEDHDGGRLASHRSLLAEQNSVPTNCDWFGDDEDLSDCRG